MGLGTGLLKILMVVFNLAFFIVGVAILALGSAVLAYTAKDSSGLKTIFEDGPQMIFFGTVIGVGAIVTIVSFLGCCGACMESKCMLMGYSVLLGLVLVLQVGAAVAGLVLKGDRFKDEAEKFFQTALNNTADNSTTPGQQALKAWDAMQEEFKCCGISAPQVDWCTYVSAYSPCVSTPVEHPLWPKSCCRDKDVAKCQIDPRERWSQGCFTLLWGYIDSYAVAAAATGIAFGLVQVIGVLIGCLLAKRYE